MDLCNVSNLTEQLLSFNTQKGTNRMPAPKRSPGKRKTGRLKRSKARYLLERLIDYEDGVLQFMDNPMVPFTNIRVENDIRMTKVLSKHGEAKMSCNIRGYLSTAVSRE